MQLWQNSIQSNKAAWPQENEMNTYDPHFIIKTKNRDGVQYFGLFDGSNLLYEEEYVELKEYVEYHGYSFSKLIEKGNHMLQ
jgi:hypothetical protein